METEKIIIIVVGVIVSYFYVKYLYLLLKNIKQEYSGLKFRIISKGIFITERYFNPIGIKYLFRVRLMAVILLIYLFFAGMTIIIQK